MTISPYTCYCAVGMHSWPRDSCVDAHQCWYVCMVLQDSRYLFAFSQSRVLQGLSKVFALLESTGCHPDASFHTHIISVGVAMPSFVLCMTYSCNSADQYVQVLLSKGVEECKILFLSLIAAPEGIHKLCSTFPRLKVITSDIDDGIGPDFQVVPGETPFVPDCASRINRAHLHSTDVDTQLQVWESLGTAISVTSPSC